MTIWIILLLVTAACTWPGLLSARREAGRKFLKAAMLAQGAAGIVLILAAAAVSVAGAVFPQAYARDAALMLLSQWLANVTVFVSGVVMGAGPAVRIASRRASAEVAERTEKKYIALATFLPVLGFFCLVLAAWCLLLPSLPPLPPGPPAEAVP
ncbi:MAG: hypothetical protein JXD23_16430 [Spirochaetales bacterium]|nr:hypothetical protein [Spirochaetales bacterium]